MVCRVTSGVAAAGNTVAHIKAAMQEPGLDYSLVDLVSCEFAAVPAPLQWTAWLASGATCTWLLASLTVLCICSLH